MTNTLLETIEKTIRRCGLLAGGEKVLAAVSGGADSVCLLDVLYKLREKLGITLCVGHVNHLLREEAAEDARYVESLARGLGLEVEIAVVDVTALAKRKKLSNEDAARQARYGALEEMAARLGAGCIAVAHTADDQVETILLNFLRGGGPEGLAGMPVSRDFASGRGKIIRPLIDVTKAEAEDYCRRNNLAVRLDATNLELAALRNRIRHKLLPLLRAEQPALNKVLLRQAEIFREEDAFLRELAKRAFDVVQMAVRAHEKSGAETECVGGGGLPACGGFANPPAADKPRRAGFAKPAPKTAHLSEGNELYAKAEFNLIKLSVAKLMELPAVLARRVVREALRSLRIGRQPLGLEQVDRVLDLARAGETGKKIELGEGLSAGKEYETLILAREVISKYAQRSPLNAQREISLPIPGEVEFEGMRLRAEKISREQVADLHDDAGGKIAYLDAAKIIPAEELIIRPPRRGDKFVPLGSNGHMKLHDFFINLKVTRAKRAKALVVCLADTIVWVAGYRIDDRYKVTEQTREVVKLHISKCIEATGRDPSLRSG